MGKKTLNCAVKDIYYNQIKKGIKRNEYRDLSDYWISKMFSADDVAAAKEKYENIGELRAFVKRNAGTKRLRWKPYTHIAFHCAGQHLEFRITRISITGGMFVISFKED